MAPMNWKDCDFVEEVPGKLGGQPVIKGTRIRAQTIIDNYEAGSPVEEIAENWPELSRRTIEGVIAYYNFHQPQPRWAVGFSKTRTFRTSCAHCCPALCSPSRIWVGVA
jgi:uncharacterized protein (DUF433 family)